MNRTLLKRATLVLAAALALTAFATREDSWRIIGPGGGGALFHPTVSPHDPRTALVASDMTGNYITTDAGGRWRHFNLGGPVQFFLFDPIDPGVIYAQAGALFRSSDGGRTWARFFPSAVAKITMGDDHAGLTVMSAQWPSILEIPASCTSRSTPPCGRPPTAAPDGGNPPTCPAERAGCGSTRARARPTAPCTLPVPTPCIADRPGAGAPARPPASSPTSRGLHRASTRPRPARSSFPQMEA